MKRLLVIPAALALANCTAIPTAISAIGGLSQAVSVNKDKVLVPVTQGLIIAHNAYQGAAQAATLAVNGCQLSVAKLLPACAKLNAHLDDLAALDNKAKTALDLADKGQDVAINVATVMNVVASIHSLIGINGG